MEKHIHKQLPIQLLLLTNHFSMELPVILIGRCEVMAIDHHLVSTQVQILSYKGFKKA